MGGPCESRGKGRARRKAKEEVPRGEKSKAREERGARSEAREQGGAKKEERGEEGEPRQGRSEEEREREERGAKRRKGSNEERFGLAKHVLLRARPLYNIALVAFSVW